MGKFINNFMIFLFCLLMLEISFYIKDINEINALNNYVKYDIEKGAWKTFKNDRYEVIIKNKNDVIEYWIIYDRESLVNISRLKKIEYYGIVNKSEI